VVERAGPEQQRGRRRVHGVGEGLVEAVGQDHQDDAGGQGDREGAGVQPAAQLGLDRPDDLLDDAGVLGGGR
jgi:hypothetical protein